MTREPIDLRVPGGGIWLSREPRPRPPPRRETRGERVQARLSRTRSSQSPAQRRLPPRPSHPRPRTGNGQAGKRMGSARWDSTAARGRPQLPTSQSFLWPRPPSHGSRERRGLSSPGAQSPGSGARSSGAAPRSPGDRSAGDGRGASNPAPAQPVPASMQQPPPGSLPGFSIRPPCASSWCPPLARWSPALLPPVRVVLLPQGPVRPQLPARGPPVAPGSGGDTHLGLGAGVWRGPAGGR